MILLILHRIIIFHASKPTNIHNIISSFRYYEGLIEFNVDLSFLTWELLLIVVQDSTKSLSQGWNKKFSPKQTLSREAGSDGECDGDRLPISVGSVGPGSPLNPVTDLNAPLGDEGEVEDISQVLTGRSGGEGRNVSQTRGEITSHQLSPHALPGRNGQL